MASYGYSAPQHYHSTVSSHAHHHHGRSRRGPRISSQNAQRQYKHMQQTQRSPKEVLVTGGVEQHQQQPTFNDYLARLEAAMSFEFDDDEVFCPFHLLTEDDLQSIHSSSSSDRGSLSSGSPDSSPLQQQVQPTPSFLLSAASVPHNTYNPTSSGYPQQQHVKLYQPMARRNPQAIPIVDPSTRVVASPPLSVSPGRQQQYVQRRGGW